MTEFDHPSLSLNESKVLVYTAFSKHFFYYRMFISKFVFEQGAVPLNPFMAFDYFLLDAVSRDQVREANNNLVLRADELWVFGPVSDGVLAEIRLAKSRGKTVRYFVLERSGSFTAVEPGSVKMEEDVAARESEL